jgi:stearoyl-CoA desaturase (Delta-9 desaturase)
MVSPADVSPADSPTVVDDAAPGRYVIRAAGLKKAQRAHAFVILLLPLAGTAYALLLAAQRSVSRLEITLLLSTYVATFAGITVGFHRLLSHVSFRAGREVRALLVILGSMACQGPPVYWVSNHRLHHRRSDLSGDPHSPHVRDSRPLGTWRGFWHAQVGWTFVHDVSNPFVFSKELLRDPGLMRINRYYYLWVFLGLTAPAAVGLALERSASGLLSGSLWGVCVRLFLSYHFANSINSVAHLFGRRDFKSNNQSTNQAWLGLPTLGDSVAQQPPRVPKLGQVRLGLVAARPGLLDDSAARSARPSPRRSSACARDRPRTPQGGRLWVRLPPPSRRLALAALLG